MMAEVTSQNPFQNVVEGLWNLSEKGLFREKSWDCFSTLQLPSKKAEVFRYLRLRQLFAKQYVAASFKNVAKKEKGLVFVNGFFRPDLSLFPDEIVALPLKQASLTYGTFLHNQSQQFLKGEKDPFAALNGALYGEGVFVYIPPKIVLREPLKVIQLIDAEEAPMWITPRVQLYIGKQAEVKVINAQEILSGDQYGMNGYIGFTIDEGASVTYTQELMNVPEAVWHLEAVRASLKRDSRFTTVHATTGSATVRHDYRVSLTEENCEARLNGVWMLQDKLEAHTNVCVDHIAPYCRSFQLFKGVLRDTSKSSFEGKIYVEKEAQKTEAYQLNKNLILSDYAQANSKPNLEIFADDVKASHGATVGQLDADQLFYLETRGLSKAQAKDLLVEGFCKEVLDLLV